MKKVINLIAILAGLLIIPMLSYAQTQYVCLYNPSTIPMVRIYDLGNLDVNWHQTVSITLYQYNSSVNAQNYVTGGILQIVSCGSITPSPTNTPTPTMTNTPTITGTINTSTPTPTQTPTFTPTITETPTPVGTVAFIGGQIANGSINTLIPGVAAQNPTLNNSWGFGTSTYEEKLSDSGPSGSFFNPDGLILTDTLNPLNDGGDYIGVFSDGTVQINSNEGTTLTGNSVDISYGSGTIQINELQLDMNSGQINAGGGVSVVGADFNLATAALHVESTPCVSGSVTILNALATPVATIQVTNGLITGI